MVMLSTRLTGSSTSMTVVSSLSALSTGSSAPGSAKRSLTSARASSPVSQESVTVAACSAMSRSAKAAR